MCWNWCGGEGELTGVFSFVGVFLAFFVGLVGVLGGLFGVGGVALVAGFVNLGVAYV